mmetsp:Transcript_83052/g.164736  ORF Transcript_83052/g.164736 Transcript_83052/m.164736 type:complete len:176 (-) Transcript_83052:36-563(-)
MAARPPLLPLVLLLASGFIQLAVVPSSGSGFILNMPSMRNKSRMTMFGVTKEVSRPGNGKTFPQKGDMVTMHYTGTLANGIKFDSSRDRNKPLVFRIGEGQVIRGWDEGVPTMSLGEKATLRISPDYAYGDRGKGPIPPNAELIFEVEVLKVESWSPLDLLADLWFRAIQDYGAV